MSTVLTKTSKSTQKCMTELEIRKLEFAHFCKTILDNPYIPNKPTIKQMEFLLLKDKEALYGGAAGGGKSDALLMAALQYVHVPDYAAILFRRTYKDLSMPGALMDRAHNWLDTTDAHWKEATKQWIFPSGATLNFAYLATENDKYNYQGPEFQFVGFDELTQFEESQYRYLFSRLRRLQGSKVPIRARVSSNPGGRGHDC
ncbi:terminase large subunit domain-containing protein [Peribacillus frigoritolerans]|uniref:terminase large subunit domain-containing protein n=1 Tax=Peribacillus frigoritolerans TaxID=450367 RepID=UPI00207A1E27|nr:terminase family protein [Peribacillus frigoritolerans]USK77743.1 terminase family protein [Peribacillus frigoritolerans]